VRKCDVSPAFLQSDDLEESEVVYVVPPPGHRVNDQHYLKLVKAVYGLGIASPSYTGLYPQNRRRAPAEAMGGTSMV